MNLEKGHKILSDKDKLTHFDNNGNAIMVDIAEKNITNRIAIARGSIKISNEILQVIMDGSCKKGDVLGVARIAAIMSVKNTSNIIPMCHPIPIDKCSVDFFIDKENNEIKAECTVSTSYKTGVEMEALTGISVALLTIYDMCKAIDKSMEIKSIYLYKKTGGKSGDFIKV